MRVYIIGFNCCGEYTIRRYFKSREIDVNFNLVTSRIDKSYIKLSRKKKNKFILNIRDVYDWILKRVRYRQDDSKRNTEMFINYLHAIYQLHCRDVLDHFKNSDNLLIFDTDTDTFSKISEFINIPVKKIEKKMKVAYTPSKYSTSIIKNITDGYPEPKYKLSIVTIMKDEQPYLKEWITVNQKLGVEHFYIYDDQSTDKPLEVLQPFIDKNIVTYTRIRRRRKYNPSIFVPGRRWIHLKDFFTKYKNDTEWVIHIDIDEFFYTKIGTLLGWIEYFGKKNKDGILVFPYEFGSKTDSKSIDEPCISRFKHRNKKLKNYTKTIVNPRLVDVDKLNNPHYLFLLNGNYCICNKQAETPTRGNFCKIQSPKNETISYPTFKYTDYNQNFVIFYNHYRYKTYEEWRNKCEKYKYNRWNPFYRDKTFRRSNFVNNAAFDDTLFRKINN